MYTNGNPILRNDPSGHRAPKWMSNMAKDIKKAMIESVVRQAGPELTLAYMTMNKRSSSRYEHKAGRALENPAAWFDRQVINPIQHMNTVELVIGVVVFVLAVIATIAFAAITGLTGGVGFAAGLAAGVAITLAGKAIGRTLGGYYADSNLRKMTWNSENADRGERIGGDGASFGNFVGGFIEYKPGNNFSIEKVTNVNNYGSAFRWGEITGAWDKNTIGGTAGIVGGDVSGKGVDKVFGGDIRNYTDNANLQNYGGQRQISHMNNIYQQRTPYYWYSGNGYNVEFVARDLFTEAVGNDLCTRCSY